MWYFGTLAATTLVPLVLLLLLHKISGVVKYIPNDQMGIVEKLWSFRGSITSGFIALNKEAGYQPDLLRGGIHFFVPFMYRIHKHPLVTVGQGTIGYLFARDGVVLGASQTLASNEVADDFQNVRHFLAQGGQRGPQRKILREGTYAINLAQFVVLTKDRVYSLYLSEPEKNIIASMELDIQHRGGYDPIVIKDNNDQLGVVTIHDGPSLPPNEIIAPQVGTDVLDEKTFHNNFQEAEKFLKAGGRRGRQLQVLVDGTYYINRLFATIELVAKTIIEVGTVGVVVSYTGTKGLDVSGNAYRHGELVENGTKGVWREPLLPGKYAWNVYAGRIISVPTTNFVLKWVSGAAGGHKLDENLAEVQLITKDAFEPSLPLSVVVHIDYQKAPEVIQRFGDVRKLVEQTLDPMVSAYFKNIGQTKTLIQLLQERADIQEISGTEMRAKFAAYSLELQEVLIGTPRAVDGDITIEKILMQLRDRQVAVEQKQTYKLQGEAAEEEKNLNDRKAIANMQASLRQSNIQIEVQQNAGAAELAKAQKDAETIRVLAQATGDRSKLEGEGQAASITYIGNANATATRAQVDAYGGAEFRLAEQIATKLFEAITAGKQPIVPQVVVTSGEEKGNQIANLVSGLLASTLNTARSLAAPTPTANPFGNGQDHVGS